MKTFFLLFCMPLLAFLDGYRINHLIYLGTHNSYHQSSFFSLPPFRYHHLPLLKQLEDQKIRQLELDIYDCADDFCVYHLPVLDNHSSCAYLSDCLKFVQTWSYEHKTHEPIFIFFESKLGFNQNKTKKLRHLIENIFLQQQILKSSEVQEVWPKVEDALGKIAFVLMRKPMNTHFFFVANQEPIAKNNIVLIEDPIRSQYEIAKWVREGHMVRTRLDDFGTWWPRFSLKRADAAMMSGAQLLSTDYPERVNY